jgi:hypothetical protein
MDDKQNFGNVPWIHEESFPCRPSQGSVLSVVVDASDKLPRYSYYYSAYCLQDTTVETVAMTVAAVALLVVAAENDDEGSQCHSTSTSIPARQPPPSQLKPQTK